MRAEERNIIIKGRKHLLDNIVDVKNILDDFITHEIISTDDAEAIRVKPTSLERKRLFLDQLPNWGPRAFQVFLDSLNCNGYGFVVEWIQNLQQQNNS